MTDARITVVIPTRNREAALRDCLDRLAAQDFPRDRMEIIVVDNGSSDGTAKFVMSKTAEDPRVRLVTQVRGGLSAARNAGWRSARHPLIVFIDDDTEAPPGYLTAIANAFAAGGDVVGGPVRIRFADARPWWLADALLEYLSAVDWGAETRPLRETEYLPGCNLAVRRNVLEDVGGFRPDLGAAEDRPGFEEDVELERQARRRGYACLYDPAATVDHAIGSERLKRAWFLRRAFVGGQSVAVVWRTLGVRGVARATVAKAHRLSLFSPFSFVCFAAKAAGFALGLVRRPRPI